MPRSFRFRPVLLLPLLLETTAAAHLREQQPTSPWTESLPPADERACDEPAMRLRGRTGGPRPLEKGSLVEVFAEGSRHHAAVPAIVTGHCTGTGSSQEEHFYGVENVYAREHLPRVDAALVRPYEVYEDGTRAACNVEARETPCAVMGHTKRESGLVLYEVVYLDGEDEPAQEVLPFSRVRRRGPTPRAPPSEARGGDESFRDWFRAFHAEAVVPDFRLS